jgi:uncharacterized phage-associated protein
MERVLDVAQYIYDGYRKVSGETIDGMKMQKLLYFAQRESLAVTGEPLFKEPMQGWKYGPVSPDVRSYFAKDGIQAPTEDVSAESAYLLNNVLMEYGSIASWKLSELSHKELSWKNTREGLEPEEKGTRELSLDDIRIDAEKVRPYDHVWDMYYDEFEDVEVGSQV